MIKKKRLPTLNSFSSENEVCGKCKPATFGIANIIYFFTKQGTLMKRSTIPSISLGQLSQSDVRYLATYKNKRTQWMFYDNQHSILSYKMVKFTIIFFIKYTTLWCLVYTIYLSTTEHLILMIYHKVWTQYLTAKPRPDKASC